MKALLAVVLMFAFSSHADVLALGLKTHHFKATPPDQCLNETHDLVALSRRGYVVGTYINSHCVRSYLAGLSYDWGGGFGGDIAIVSNYPKKMHILGPLIVIPQLTYTEYWRGFGVKLSWIPSVLVGVGFVYQLD